MEVTPGRDMVIEVEVDEAKQFRRSCPRECGI
jgi:hypothetical protein